MGGIAAIHASGSLFLFTHPATKKARRGFPRRAMEIRHPRRREAPVILESSLAYFACSAEFVMALPPFEISCPAPAIVLQPARAAVPAMRSKAISRFMRVLLVENASVDVPVLEGAR